ncbi:MAG: class I SAM-dependent methyltransferase [bacterium]
MKNENLWYQDWFASDLYLQVYKHRDYKEAESFLLFMLKELNLAKNFTILDAACGAGRHCNFLSNMGYNAVGFDLSKTLLKIAC